MGYKDYTGPDAPSDIAAFLLRFGKTAFGNPRYRFVLAAAVYEKVGQEWHDWPDSTPVEKRGIPSVYDAYGTLVCCEKPTRVVTEVREVQTYPHIEDKGWILERWMPPSYFGSESDWYARVVPKTSVPLGGPYPHEGKYIMVGGPFLKPPSMSFMEDQVGWCERSPEKLAASVEQHVRMKVERAIEAHEKKEQATADESAYRLRDAISFYNVISLGAGRLRNRAAERHGIRSHMGN